MEWLDFIEMIKKQNPPIEDIDSYLNYVSKWPLFINLASAAICLGLSTIYHLFFVYSPEACLLLAKLDYTGITILIFGSTVPGITYMFACSNVVCKNIELLFDKDLRYIFMTISGVSCLVVFFVTLMPVFSKPEYKWLRGILFVSLGVSVGAPLVYLNYYL